MKQYNFPLVASWFALLLLTSWLAPLDLTLAAEKLQFGAAFRGAPRYDLLSHAAETQGFWKEQGLVVEWVPFRGASLMFQAVAANKMQIGLTDVASLVQAAARATQVIIVADLKSPSFFFLWARADGPIKKAEDLKGARIGISRMGGASHAFAQLVAKSLGIDKQVRIISLGGQPERMAALKSGAIEAFIQTFPPVANFVVKGEIKELAATSDFLSKDWIDNVVFARRDFSQTNREIVRKVVRALLKAAQFIMADQAWTKNKLQSLMSYSAEAMPLVARELNFTGAGSPITQEAMQATLNFFIEYGIIPRDKPPLARDLYTNEFVKQ